VLRVRRSGALVRCAVVCAVCAVAQAAGFGGRARVAARGASALGGRGGRAPAFWDLGANVVWLPGSVIRRGPMVGRRAATGPAGANEASDGSEAARQRESTAPAKASTMRCDAVRCGAVRERGRTTGRFTERRAKYECDDSRGWWDAEERNEETARAKRPGSVMARSPNGRQAKVRYGKARYFVWPGTAQGPVRQRKVPRGTA